MRGVIAAFLVFVALGSGLFIWRDRRVGPTQLEDAVPAKNSGEIVLERVPKPRAVGYQPKHTDAPFVLSVPFISQAPFGNWADSRQEDGCEEASSLMAMRWRESKTIAPTEGLAQILAIADYEKKTYGSFHDTSAADTVDRILKGYFKYSGAYIQYAITKDDILETLDRGNLVMVPANGQLLDNPNYTRPGPLEHMLIVKGYDMATKEFITNDPGTRRGEGFRYDMGVFMKSLRDYPTGKGEPLTGHEPSAMIIITKSKQ